MLRPTSLLTNRSFTDDDRAIEGLPIRLVIALVVGVASLSIMMSMLGGIGDFGTTEVTVEYENGVIDHDENDFEIAVVSNDGEPVMDSHVVIESGSAQIETFREHTGENDHTIEIDFGPGQDIEVDFRSNQDIGTLEVNIIPPTDGDFEDAQSNAELTVIEN